LKGIRIAIAMTMASMALASGGVRALTVSCAGATTSGGDWPTHGGSLLGTRSQPDEHTLGVDNVLNLQPQWSFSVADQDASGTLETIPIEADGCVYVQTTTGHLFALNADNGELVWDYESGAGSSFSAPTAVDGVLYTIVPTTRRDHGKGIHVDALDAATGTLIYSGEELAEEDIASAQAGAGSSAVYFDGMLFVGLTSAELSLDYAGGYALVDASNGSLIKRGYTTPAEDQANGIGTCSIWSTPAIDPETKKLYVGTGQPSGWFDKESEMCNAIIKIDLEPGPTYGEIIGSVKGIPDDPPYIDVDFGSAPVLLNDASGRQIVAQLQKAGQVTAGYTRHMTFAWRTPVSPVGAALGNFTQSATDGSNVFTVGAYPGMLYSLAGDTGVPNWAVPVTSPVATTSVAYANGVVYYNSDAGVITAHDATNGVPLFARPIAADNAACDRNQAGGIAIARNNILAACGPVVAAYGL